MVLRCLHLAIQRPHGFWARRWKPLKNGRERKTVKTISNATALSFIVCAALLSAPARSHAWAPNNADLSLAVNAGSFSGYYSNLSAWVSQKVPASAGGVDEPAMKALLKDPVFANALCQRTLLQKYGVGNLEGFAKADQSSKTFLLWLLQNTKAMDLYLIGAVPVGIRQREANNYELPGGSLNIWKRIYDTDPESRQGLYLRLAIATALNPPGTSGRGAGQAAKPVDPVDRYNHFKTAHKKRQLFPSFDRLTVWDLRHVVSSNASDTDLAWGREMVNTWAPQLRENEKVVDTTSQVWRRNSPISLVDYKAVLDGGGKCGPRSSWSVFINQAFGIPALGVGQPAHACVAYKSIDGTWLVAYGRSWAASRLIGLSGAEFVEGVTERARTAQFSQVEHLRWLALVPAPRERTDAVLALVRKVQTTPPPAQKDMAALENADETDDNVPGSQWISLMPVEEKPDVTTELQLFEVPPNIGDKYTARVRGFVYPPGTGDYVFRIASDDASDLFLSTDATPANKKCIAYVARLTDRSRFPYPTQTSKPMRLVAGKKYYIEALHRELVGADHLTVVWSGPGVDECVIKGEHLSSYPTGAKGRIVREVWHDRVNTEAPIVAAPGVIHVEAESFAEQSGVGVLDCYTGGKQIYFGANAATAWVGYKILVPATGIYELTARLAVANSGQNLFVRSFGAMAPVKKAEASAVWRGMTKDLGPQMAVDNNPGTRWAVNEKDDQCVLEVDLGQPTKISTVMIDERAYNRVSKFQVDYKTGEAWKTLFDGTNIGIGFSKDFSPVTAQFVRLNILDTREAAPTIWEFSVGSVKDGSAWLLPPCTHGLWETTKPVDLSLVKGAQTVWIFAPYQRGVAMRWFELKPSTAKQLTNAGTSIAPAKDFLKAGTEDEL